MRLPGANITLLEQRNRPEKRIIVMLCGGENGQAQTC